MKHSREAVEDINGGPWGYKSYDTKWKPPDRFIRDLVKCAGGGGNYLLNVGPTDEGIIPAGSVKVLRDVGKWLKKNGESIYGTRGGPFNPIVLTWGSCTRKERKLYLHIVKEPKGGVIDLPGLATEITKVHLFGDSMKTCVLRMPQLAAPWRFAGAVLRRARLPYSQQTTLPSIIEMNSFPSAAAMPSNTGQTSSASSLSFRPSAAETTCSSAPLDPRSAAT